MIVARSPSHPEKEASVMQISRPQTHFQPVVRFAGFGDSAADQVARAVAFANRARTTVVDPTLAKSQTRLISPVNELRTELRRVCGTGVGENVEVGRFLQILDCWVTEAFGWWAQTEQIAVQTIDVGTALLSAGVQVRDAVNQPGSTPEAVGRQFFPPEFINQAISTGTTLQSIGTLMLTQAISWKPVLRDVLLVSHTLRDIVILFNDAVEQGTLPNDGRTAQLRDSLETTVEAWKREIINRVVDAAFATRRFALGQAQKNQELISIGFDLAALTPQALIVIQDLKRRIDELVSLLDIAALPGNALAGLGEMAADATGAVARGAVNVVFDLGVKLAAIAAGLAIIGTGVAVVLKKTGVIGRVRGQ